MSLLNNLGGAQILSEGVHPHGGHDLILIGAVGTVGVGGGDFVHHIHAGGDHAEGGIVLVKEGGICMADEELAAGGIIGQGRHEGMTLAGHGDHAPDVGQIVVHVVVGKFALDAIVGAAHAGTGGVAALDHEALDDPVEDHAVIKAFVGQGDEVLHGVGGLVVAKFHGDDAAIGHGDGGNGVLYAHAFLLLPAAQGKNKPKSQYENSN